MAPSESQALSRYTVGSGLVLAMLVEHWAYYRLRDWVQSGSKTEAS